MRHHRGLVAAALFALAACSSDSPAGPADDAIDAPFGALEPRMIALDAFQGGIPPVKLRMVLHTVEGARVEYTLEARANLAILTSDLRRNGGALRTDTLTALTLVRYYPAVWENNVEVRKERFEVADLDAPLLVEGTYLLMHPRCLLGPCTELF
jgi:hypothetical protein